MICSNILLGNNVYIDPSSSINNVKFGNRCKVAKNCSIYGSSQYVLSIGDDCYIGMNSIINGFSQQITIGNNVSIAQNVNLMADSGPNMSTVLQKLFPIEKFPIIIGNDCWIGAGAVLLPGTILSDRCIVGANSVVRGEFVKGSIIVGAMAKAIRIENYDI